MSLWPRSNTISFDAALRDAQHAEARVQIPGLQALGHLTDHRVPRATELLLKAVVTGNTDVQTTALTSLALLQASAAVPIAMEKLTVPTDSVAVAAMDMLAAISPCDDSAVAGALLLATKDARPIIRYRAIQVLADQKLSGQAQAQLACRLQECLQDDNHDVISIAALALADIPHRESIGYLQEILAEGPYTSKDFDIAYALCQMADPKGFTAMDSLLQQSTLPIETLWDGISIFEQSRQKPPTLGLENVVSSQQLDLNFRMQAAKVLLVIDRTFDGAQTRSGQAQSQSLSQNKEYWQTIIVKGLKALRLRHRSLAVSILSEVAGPWAITPLRRASKRRRNNSIQTEILRILHALE